MAARSISRQLCGGVAGLAALLMLPTIAIACAAFEDVVQKASENYASSPGSPIKIYGIIPNTCDIATSPDGIRIYHCRWDYTYREPAAVELMRTINIEIQKCLGVQSRKIEDGVNHPDTYEQRLFRLGDINISLSLKDKAALNQSFVFLRISGVAP